MKDPNLASEQFIMLSLGLGLAEHVRDDQGGHALVIVDNLLGLSRPMSTIGEINLKIKLEEDNRSRATTKEGQNEDDDMVMIDGMYISASAAERRTFLSTQLQRTAKCTETEKRMTVDPQLSEIEGKEQPSQCSNEIVPSTSSCCGGSLTMLIMAKSNSKPGNMSDSPKSSTSTITKPTAKISIKLEDVDKYNLSPEAKEKLIQAITMQEAEAEKSSPLGPQDSVEDGMVSRSIIEEIKSICDGHIYLESSENFNEIKNFINSSKDFQYALTAKESCPRIGYR